MGNAFAIWKKSSLDPDVAWKLQNKEMAENPMYDFVNLANGGRLIKAYEQHGPDRVKEIARTDMIHYLHNGGKGREVTRSDYLRWCEIMRCKARDLEFVEKSNHDIEANFVKDRFNNFQPHETCWDLFKRGGVGETPFHLCYLNDTPVHFEVAKALLEVFPKLALDVYEGEEYFGESALHIAVILGDLDAVQLLVKQGANINQRAVGRFFLPEDQKNKPVKETDYSGYCYYGEYPLAFAACRGNEELYDYLIENGADPNRKDSFGNTVLHMMVIHEQSELFKHAVRHPKIPARTDILNNQKLTPLTLASKLGRSQIFKDMLDLGSMISWRFSNTMCAVYPLAALDSIGPNGETSLHSALMIIVNGETDEHLDMLEGGVIGQLLREKWKTFARRRFIERLVIAIVHLILLSVAIYVRPQTSDNNGNLLRYRGSTDGVRYFCEIMVCISCLFTVISEIIEVASQGFRTFIRNCAHAPDQTVYLISCLLILACVPCRFLEQTTAEDILLIIAAPGSWFFLLFFARGTKLTGPFVTMIYKMLSGDLFRFAIIYCIFLVGFTQGFYVLFRDVPQDNSEASRFSSLIETILTLFQMTLGEFKYEAFNTSRYTPLTKIVFAIFMILMPILLLNMLIAMMGNTYNQVIAKSEKEWRMQWAKIVVVLERGFTKKQLLKFQKDYSVALTGVPKHQLGEYSDPTIEQRALVVIKTSSKSRAKTIKGAIINWKRMGKEIIRQKREWRMKGRNVPFVVQKRRANMTLDDLGMANLSGTVQQLAWEKDMDFNKGQNEGLSPRGDAPWGAGGRGSRSPRADDPWTSRADGRKVDGQVQGRMQNGGPRTLPNGTAGVKVQPGQSAAALHDALLSTTTKHLARNLVYNRVGPLLTPFPQQDDRGSESNATPSEAALEPQSMSSRSENTQCDSREAVPGAPHNLLSAKMDSAGDAVSGAGKDISLQSGSDLKNVEMGRTLPASGGFSVTKDVETCDGVEVAQPWSETLAQSSNGAISVHKQHHHNRKKKSKGGKHSRENTPKQSRESTPKKSPSPHSPTPEWDKFDTLERD